ncbi:MAG: YeeE/YedE thiosulfate transporter family protein [Bacteroidota bacterium]
MEYILRPWPWYASGPLIALVLFVLIMMGRRFGMSSNLRTMCTALGADKHAEFFRFDWKAQKWNLLVVVGVILGGFIGHFFLSDGEAVAINSILIAHLNELGFSGAGKEYLPSELFGETVFTNPKMLLFLIVGGFFVGFGARYAGGCTSGHAISGLSNLQLPSLIAVIGFFIGGLLMVHVLFPILF